MRDHLDFSDNTKFYFIQLQQRKKDDPTFPANNRTVKSYFISTLDDYNRLESEIKKLSDETKSRVYIRLNRRSYEQVLLDSMRSICQMLQDKNYLHVKGTITSSAGCVCSEKNKSYLIDIDYDEWSDGEFNENELIEYINSLRPEGYKYVLTVPTLHGVHLIVNKFDTNEFHKRYPYVAVHTDNPTLLYFKNDN